MLKHSLSKVFKMLILLLLAIFVKGENKWAKVLPNGMRLLLVKFLLLFAMCPLPGQILTYNVMHGHSKIGWLSKTSCRIYIVISFLAVLIMALSFIKP